MVLSCALRAMPVNTSNPVNMMFFIRLNYIYPKTKKKPGNSVLETFSPVKFHL